MPVARRLLAAALSATLLAAASDARAEQGSFAALLDDHMSRQRAALGYFGAVSALQLGAGTALLLTDLPGFADKPRGFRRGFAAFSLIYGALNAAFVAANLASLSRQPEVLTSAPLVQHDRLKQSRALAGNAGLDMIYITLGLTLWAGDDRPFVQGMSAAVALNGALTLGYDGGAALLMSR